jgi:predicted regulator of Ras-like GTPase activity (Roadblock/LC7/MglB family)
VLISFPQIPTKMFKFLKRIFGKDSAADSASESNAPARPAPAAPKQADRTGSGVEVATLSLRAILEKLQPDLKALINQIPDAAVTIVLPVNTILKQIGTGAVKMSLASLIRQAPAGTFRKAQVEDKCMVDVPLAEIFKTLNPARLSRRSDQRRYDIPEDASGLFGPSAHTRSVPSPSSQPLAENAPVVQPRVVTPVETTSEAPVGTPASPAPIAEAAPAAEPQKILRMPGLSPVEAPVPANGNGHAIEATPAHPAVPTPAPEPMVSPAGISNQLVLPLVELAAGWPEGIRSELSLLSGDTKLVLPVFEVSAGLQKGKVSFAWSQIRGWLRPLFTGKIGIADDFQLILPLKVVAPAFVAATGATKRQQGATVDQSLPDFFGPASGQPTATASSQPNPEASPVPLPASLPVPTPEVVAAAEPEPASEVKFSLVRETPIETESPEPATALEPMQAPEPAPVAGELTLQQLFNQPEKSHWTPAELISHTCGLPGVAGAVIALEEGLVVAQQLPAGFAAETFAAFMPQIFGRLGRYTHEMQLGDADEIIFQTASGPCHLARHGKVFFATVGRPGQPLPTGLKLIPAQLAHHNQ